MASRDDKGHSCKSQSRERRAFNDVGGSPRPPCSRFAIHRFSEHAAEIGDGNALLTIHLISALSSATLGNGCHRASSSIHRSSYTTAFRRAQLTHFCRPDGG